MIKNIDDYLIGVCIGIRFRANFSIGDSLGAIVDKILYDKKAYFNPSVFPMVRNNSSEKILFNDNNNDRLTINNSNIILDLFFDGSFKLEDYDTIIEKFNETIIEGIMKHYKITEINRIGIIKRYLFTVEDLADSFLAKTIGQTIDGINDINLRFSKKLPTADALIKREIFDYHNAIFNIIKHADKKELFMSVDYQKYFQPSLTSVSEMKFIEFSNIVDNFTDNNSLTWINKNYLN